MEVFLQEENAGVRDLLLHTLTMSRHKVHMSDAENPAYKVIAEHPDIKLALVDMDIGLEPLVALAEIKRRGGKFMCFLYGTATIPALAEIVEALNAKIICKTEIVRCLQQEGII